MPSLALAFDPRGAEQGAQRFDTASNRVVRSAGKADKAMVKLDKSTQRLGKTMGGARRMVVGLAGGFSAFLAIRSAVRTIATFQQSMSTLRAVTRANTDEMAALEKSARTMGATTRFSARQAADAQVELARAGLSTKQIIGALPATLRLAQAGELELAAAAKVAARAMSTFQIPAENVNRVSDVLVRQANAAVTNVGEMAEAFNFAAGPASQFGNSLEVTAAALGTMAQKGEVGSKAGSGLTQMLASLADMTDKQKEALDDLNIAYEDMNPATRSITEIMRTLADAGADATDVYKIFPVRAARAALALVTQVDALEAAVKANEEAAGTAEEAARIMDDNLVGAALALRSAWEELTLKTGDAGFAGTLRFLIDTLTDAIRVLVGMESHVKGNVKVAKFLAKAIEVTTTALIGFIAVKAILFFASLAQAVLRLALAFRALTVAMATNPIGAIAVLAAAAVTALVALQDETVKLGDEQFQLGDIVAGTWQFIKEKVALGWDQAMDVVRDGWDWFKETSISVGNWFQDQWQKLTNFIGVDWKEVFKTILDVVKTFANKSIAILVGIGKTIAVIIKRLHAAARAVADFDFTDPIGSLRRIRTRLRAALNPRDIIGEIGDEWKQAWNRDFVGEATGAVVKWAKQVQTSVSKWVDDAAKTIKRAMKEAGEDIINRARTEKLIREATERAAINLPELPAPPTLPTPDIPELPDLPEIKEDVDAIADAADSMGQSIAQAFGDAAQGAKNFGELALQVFDSIRRAIIDAAIVQPLSTAFAGFIKGAAKGGGNGGASQQQIDIGNSTANIFVPNARGNVLSSGNVVPFAGGGLFMGPHFFGMSNNRIGMIGERKPGEAALPLKRMRSGDLGVSTEGIAQPTHVTNINMTVQATDANSFRRNERQIARQLRRMATQ